jgi:CBS domain-containing protein/ribosome-associated translation inhibitor RaiA
MARVQTLSEMTLSMAVEPLPATLEADAELSTALGHMRKYGLHEIAVLDKKGRLMGLLSDETLLKRRRLALNTLVANLLVVPPHLTTEDPISRGAEALLANSFREMPVFEPSSEKVAGQTTRWLLLQLLKNDKEINALPAHSVMTPDPIVVKEEDTIDHALDLMRQLDEPTIPVVDKGGDLTGVVSARDILRLYAGWTSQKRVPHGSPKRQVRARVTVEGIMTSPVVEAPRDRTVGEIIQQMLDSKASSVVITGQNKPVGIITKGDLVEMIASLAPREGVFLQITGLEGHDPFVLEDVFSVLEPSMKKLAHFVKPLTCNIHVMEHHRNYGHRAEVRVRLQTDRGLFTATDEGDDIGRATVSVLERLEKQVIREKERRRPSPRKARSGVQPAGQAKVV